MKLILRIGNLSWSLLSFNSSHPFSLLKFCPGISKQTLSIFRLQWFTFTGQMICDIINSFCEINKATCYFIPLQALSPSLQQFVTVGFFHQSSLREDFIILFMRPQRAAHKDIFSPVVDFVR